MTYIPLPQKEKGGQKEIWTADEDIKELLRQVLVELKTMNIHLHTITEEEIIEGDL